MDREVLRYILKKGIDIDAQNEDGNTALHLAASKNDPKILKFLLKNKAKNDILNENRMTALDQSIFLSCPLTFEVLYPLTRSSQKNNIGYHAISSGNIDMVKLIDSKDRSYFFKKCKGMENTTPVHIAAAIGSMDIMEYLLQEI